MENKNKMLRWIFVSIILIFISSTVIFNVEDIFSMDKLRIYEEEELQGVHFRNLMENNINYAENLKYTKTEMGYVVSSKENSKYYLTFFERNPILNKYNQRDFYGIDENKDNFKFIVGKLYSERIDITPSKDNLDIKSNGKEVDEFQLTKIITLILCVIISLWVTNRKNRVKSK